MVFICYEKCSTCKKAEKWLNDNNIRYEIRDIKLNNPTIEELTDWYVRSNIELKKFFNTSGMVYRSMHLKDQLPSLSENEKLRLLSTDGMLVKRPLLIDDKFVKVGFNKSEWEELLQRKS